MIRTRFRVVTLGSFFMLFFAHGCHEWPCDDFRRYPGSRISLMKTLGEVEPRRFENLPVTVAFEFGSRPEEDAVAAVYQRAFDIGVSVWPDAVETPLMNVADDNLAADIAVSVEIDPDPNRQDDCETQCGVDSDCVGGITSIQSNIFNVLRPSSEARIFRNAFEECRISDESSAEEAAHAIGVVVAHELGHAMGLIGHSPMISDLMYSENISLLEPELVSDPDWRTQEFDLFDPGTWLSNGDINTMRSIYCM